MGNRTERKRGKERDRWYTQMWRPTKQVELNKRILRIDDARELCDLISTHVAELNLSTRRMLQTRCGQFATMGTKLGEGSG
jgi:hypothetical protein